MARFRATMQGQRGMASRLGNAKSGILVNANGWNTGVRVFGYVDKDGNDCFAIHKTGGSNDAMGPHTHIATVIQDKVIVG